MALVKTGTFTRSGGIYDAIKKQIKILTFEPVKKVLVKFDPFTPQSEVIRTFLFCTGTKKVRVTNPYCKFDTKILCDRSEATVEFLLNNGESVLLKCNHLNTVDILKIFNQHISSLVPKEQPSKDQKIATKIYRK